MKTVRLMTYIHDVTMDGVATTFMCADTRASRPVAVHAHDVVHDTTWFGHAIFDRCVYVVNFIEY